MVFTTKLGAIVVSVAPRLLTFPDDAVMTLLPTPTTVTSPEELIVATAGLDDVQVTRFVTSPVVPSRYVPAAVNCFVKPTTPSAFCGPTEIEAMT